MQVLPVLAPYWHAGIQCACQYGAGIGVTFAQFFDKSIPDPYFEAVIEHNATAQLFILVPIVLPCRLRTRIIPSNTYSMQCLFFVAEEQYVTAPGGVLSSIPKFWGKSHQTHRQRQTQSIPQRVYCTSPHAPVITNVMASIPNKRSTDWGISGPSTLR